MQFGFDFQLESSHFCLHKCRQTSTAVYNEKLGPSLVRNALKRKIEEAGIASKKPYRAQQAYRVMS